MKTLLNFAALLLTFVVFVDAQPHGPPIPPHKRAAMDTCLKKLGLTGEEFRHFAVIGEKHKDQDCFAACVFKELGMINKEGDIVEEATIKEFPPWVPQENRTLIFDACSKQKGANDCETADLYSTCVMKLLPLPPMDPQLLKAHETCMERLSITTEDVRKMVMSADQLEKECYYACIAKETGLMNEKGALEKETFIKNLPPHVDREDAQKITDECAKEEREDECETVILLMKCFGRNKLPFGGFHGRPHHLH